MKVDVDGISFLYKNNILLYTLPGAVDLTLTPSNPKVTVDVDLSVTKLYFYAKVLDEHGQVETYISPNTGDVEEKTEKVLFPLSLEGNIKFDLSITPNTTSINGSGVENMPVDCAYVSYSVNTSLTNTK